MIGSSHLANCQVVIVVKDKLENDDAYYCLPDNILVNVIPGSLLERYGVKASDTDISWRYVDRRGSITKTHYRMMDLLVV
jgi:hypothetical protein